MVDEVTSAFQIRPLNANDRNWVAHFLDKHWSSTKIVSRGQAYYAHLLPGFVAELTDAPEDAPAAGLITYRVDGTECEIMTLDSLNPNQGIGTALVAAVKEAAKEQGCKRLWLITTNDNLEALQFYQKRDFRLVAVHVNALSDARKLKPQIPLVGKHSIPLHDEIELALKI
ncbi:MAG: GNAT family N-acetyltransferase [Aggregatilineales bacterium]